MCIRDSLVTEKVQLAGNRHGGKCSFINQDADVCFLHHTCLLYTSCKAVLRNEARNYHRNKKRLLDREKSFSVLSMEELGQLTSVDHYPSEEFVFSSYGCDLHIDNELVDVYKRQLAGIFVLTQAFGKRLSQFTADLCQTLDHMIAGNEAPQRPEDSETQLARIGPVSYTHLFVGRILDLYFRILTCWTR